MSSRGVRPFLCTLIALAIAAAARPGAAPQGPDEFGRGAYAPGPGIDSPVLLQSEKPAYPQSALAARVQGTVEFEVVVLKDGTVGQVRTVHSVDSMKALEAAALEAARGWRFQPGSVAGQPVPAIARLAVQFTLGPAGFGQVEVKSGPQPSEDSFSKGAFRPGRALVNPTLLRKVR